MHPLLVVFILLCSQSDFSLLFYGHVDVDSTNLDDYNIHVIGSVFKQWLRELPNPLMTFELYEEFIRAMGKYLISDTGIVVRKAVACTCSFNL